MHGTNHKHSYRQVVKKLKAFGFIFDRHAAGSHEIWYNEETDRYTTVQNHPGDIPEGTLRAIDTRQLSCKGGIFNPNPSNKKR